MLPKYLVGLLRESGYGINRQSNFLMIAKFLRKTRNKPISRDALAEVLSFFAPMKFLAETSNRTFIPLPS